MPVLKCVRCHHEWEGKKDTKCDWCGEGSYVLEEHSALEKMLSDPKKLQDLIRKIGEDLQKKNEEN